MMCSFLYLLPLVLFEVKKRKRKRKKNFFRPFPSFRFTQMRGSTGQVAGKMKDVYETHRKVAEEKVKNERKLTFF